MSNHMPPHLTREQLCARIRDVSLLLVINPSTPEWDKAYSALADNDAWVRNKLNRQRRYRDHIEYLCQYAPEVASLSPGIVVDLGPGGGELLEIAAALGHFGLGVDSPVGEGGMGDRYLRASKLWWQRQRLDVLECGARDWFQTLARAHIEQGVLLNCRGSLEQIFCDHMDGPPHHQHRDAKRLRWRFSEELTADLRAMFNGAAHFLKQHGVFLIHANGSADDGPMDDLLQRLAHETTVFGCKQLGPNLHKFTKLVNATEGDPEELRELSEA